MTTAPTTGEGPFAVTVDDGVQLCVESFGDPRDPTLVLVGGATASMDWWPVEWCERIVGGGLRVVRYDHRDTGGSTSWPVGEPGYSGRDLASDLVRLLDAVGLRSAHLMGVSMGGGIAQAISASAPDRVRSLTLVATGCAFERADPQPLPGPEPRVAELFANPPAEPDWEDDDAVVAHLVAGQRAFAGDLGLDEATATAVARRVVSRTRDARASLTNHWVVVDGPDEGPARTMADVGAPTLVVHGSDDPLFPLPHGEALAREIAGARLVVVPGMGHEVPPRPTWDRVVPEVLAHALAVERQSDGTGSR